MYCKYVIIHVFNVSFYILKGPKLEIFGSGVFTQIRPVRLGDFGIRPKNPKF